jgi:hypothetical protein
MYTGADITGKFPVEINYLLLITETLISLQLNVCNAKVAIFLTTAAFPDK